MSVAAKSSTEPMLLSVGTATPAHSYRQADLLARYQITDRRISSVFANSHIDRRNLYLPDTGHNELSGETQAELLDKHLRGALDIGVRAAQSCLATAGLTPTDVDYLCCVTSTGFLCPGLSAYLIRALGLRPSCSRVDVVGMGCNA